MVTKFFKSEYYIQLFVLIAIILTIFLFKPINYLAPNLNFSVSFINLSINNKILHSVFSFILIIINALLIRRILSINDFISKKSFLPAFIFSFTALIFKDSQYFLQILITNIVIVFSFGEFLKIYNKSDSFDTIFKNSFLFSSVSLVYFPSIFFIPIIWLTLIIFRIFKWREWVISIIGIFTPYFIFLSFLFLTNNFVNYISTINTFFISFKVVKLKLNIQEKIFLMVFITTYLLSFFSVMRKFNDKNIYFRKRLSIMLNFTFLCIIIITFGLPELKGNFLYLTTSYSLFLTSYLGLLKSNWKSELIYYILIISFFFVLLN